MLYKQGEATCFTDETGLFIPSDLKWPTRRWAHNRDNPVTIPGEAPGYCGIIRAASRLNRTWIINSAAFLARLFRHVYTATRRGRFYVKTTRRKAGDLSAPSFLSPHKKKIQQTALLCRLCKISLPLTPLIFLRYSPAARFVSALLRMYF